MNRVSVSHSQEKRKRLLYIVILLILIVLAILGYSLEEKKIPGRIAISTAGGGVIFNHQQHMELKTKNNTMNCGTCHHNYKEGPNAQPSSKDNLEDMKCRVCHYRKGKPEVGNCAGAAIHKRCIGKQCLGCHAAEPEKFTVACQFCHNAEHFSLAKTPQQVTFVTDAGLVVFDHFLHISEDGCAIECETCHHGYDAVKKKQSVNMQSFPMSCRRCHYNTFYGDICDSDEMHARCIGKQCIECHDDGGDNCQICHKEE